jgi:hypothetical protein
MSNTLKVAFNYSPETDRRDSKIKKDKTKK